MIRMESFPFLVCMHFAARPDSLLTTPQAVELYGGESASVATLTLRRVVDAGWLTCEAGGKGVANEYTAGPRILRLHGRAS